jgi:hypothetical protein
MVVRCRAEQAQAAEQWRNSCASLSSLIENQSTLAPLAPICSRSDSIPSARSVQGPLDDSSSALVLPKLKPRDCQDSLSSRYGQLSSNLSDLGATDGFSFEFILTNQGPASSIVSNECDSPRTVKPIQISQATCPDFDYFPKEMV